MNSKKAAGIEDLISTLSASMTDEEFALSVLQALIASEISTKRQKLGMSQKEFAEAMGVSQALVSRWESGDANYTLSTLVGIASKLGLEMQSPFAPAASKSRTAESELIPFPSSFKWSSESTSAPVYTQETIQELKEM